MTNFALLCPALAGHYNPMLVLGKELKQRGHQVTFIQILDLEAKIQQEGLAFYPLGEEDYPVGKLSQFLTKLGQLKGVEAVKYWHKEHEFISGIICRELKLAIEHNQIEVLLLDQLEPAAAAVAQWLNIPFITICNALVLNREPSIPPIFTTWVYQNNWLASLRNRLFYNLGDMAVAPYNRVLTEYRQKWRLPKLTDSELFFANSQLLQVSQQPGVFDFPRKNLPTCFHYTGPWRDNSSQDIPFPYEKLTDKPLIYASLGTLQISKYEVFYCIAQACQDLDAQLVISHGGGMNKEQAEGLPGNTLVVSYAPQVKLFTHAKLVITHGGLNTVLDALSNGVPLVAIPIAFEQPAIAARIQWTGVGEFIALKQLNPSLLKQTIEKVLRSPRYTSNALKFKKAITQSGGVQKAAQLIEEVIVLNH